MEKKCVTCEGELVEVTLKLGIEEIKIERPRNGLNIFGKINSSDVKAYVCTQCGYIQLIATYPEIFKTKQK